MTKTDNPFIARTVMVTAEGVGYEIADKSRRRRSYNFVTGISASADRHLNKLTLAQLRERCRMYDRESSLFTGMIQRGIDNIVGSNFDFVPRTNDKELDKKAKDYITAKMDKRNCDVSETRHFKDLLATTLRSIWNDGDNLWTKRTDGRVLIFEADQVETDTEFPGVRIVMGVELGDYNQPLAYYVKPRQTQGDSGMLKNQNLKAIRIPANDAFLPAWRTRFNQTRGVPYFATILSFFDRTNNYLDYESLAAESGAMSGFKITKKGEYEPPATTGDFGNTDADTSEYFPQKQKLEPGFTFEGAIGEDMSMIASNRPGSSFEPYIVMCCRIIGAGIGLPLELMMLDFSKTNYSSARASMGEARRMFRSWQNFLELEVCMPWYRWQISRGIASGALPPRAELFLARCQWPAWDYIDPVKEAQGNLMAVSGANKSISECIRERGGEPQEVFAELAEDLLKIKELGIVLPGTNVTINTNYNQE
jgi:lambda family phage portal protein